MTPDEIYALPTAKGGIYKAVLAWNEPGAPTAELLGMADAAPRPPHRSYEGASGVRLSFETKLSRGRGRDRLAYHAAVFSGRPFAVVVEEGQATACIVTDTATWGRARAAVAQVVEAYARATLHTARPDEAVDILDGVPGTRVVELGGRMRLVSAAYLDDEGRPLLDEEILLIGFDGSVDEGHLGDWGPDRDPDHAGAAFEVVSRAVEATGRGLAPTLLGQWRRDRAAEGHAVEWVLALAFTGEGTYAIGVSREAMPLRPRQWARGLAVERIGGVMDRARAEALLLNEFPDVLGYPGIPMTREEVGAVVPVEAVMRFQDQCMAALEWLAARGVALHAAIDRAAMAVQAGSARERRAAEANMARHREGLDAVNSQAARVRETAALLAADHGALFLPVGAHVRVASLAEGPDLLPGCGGRRPQPGSEGVVAGIPGDLGERAVLVAFTSFVSADGGTWDGQGRDAILVRMDARNLDVLALGTTLDGEAVRDVTFRQTHVSGHPRRQSREMVVLSAGLAWRITEGLPGAFWPALDVTAWPSADELDFLVPVAPEA